MRELLDPEVRWGAPGEGPKQCVDAEQVLSWWKRAREGGTSAQVTEVLVGSAGMLVGLAVGGPGKALPIADELQRWQVLTLSGGRIVEIIGFEERGQAAARAGLPG